jgi:hypothetical protein
LRANARKVQRTLPTGVPERDYPASLAVSEVLLSKENLAAAVAELIDSGRVIVAGLVHGGVQAAALTADFDRVGQAARPRQLCQVAGVALQFDGREAIGTIAANSLGTGAKPGLSRTCCQPVRRITGK